MNGLLKNYGVSDVHELSFEQWKEAMDILKSKPRLEEATAPKDDGPDELPWNQPR